MQWLVLPCALQVAQTPHPAGLQPRGSYHGLRMLSQVKES